jgi:ADP-ribosyl-[dinitrogen reductase] hydrolase
LFWRVFRDTKSRYGIVYRAVIYEINQMFGTIIGDIIGSAYEFSAYKGKDFKPLFHPKARFTDDTICTVAIAQALLDNADPATTLIAWCDRYAENGGWGRAFAQ